MENLEKQKQAADESALARAAVTLAAELLSQSEKSQTWSEKWQGSQLARLMQDPAGKAFTLAMADQVFRPPSPRRSAAQFRHLVDLFGIPQYLSLPERIAMRLGSITSAFAPSLVMPAITGAMRSQASKVILPAENSKLKPLLNHRRSSGMRMNLNQLGEAVLGEKEAEKRLQDIVARIQNPDCDYLSVKLSSIFSQIHLVAYQKTLDHVCERLRLLYRAAISHPQKDGQPKFINLDMEEYRDLRLTCDAFQRVLDEPEFHQLRAGIVLQAYLPDSWPFQQKLCAWARERVAKGGARIKIRIVKGANLAMEKVEAELHDWPCAVYSTKEEVDANYKRMVHEACRTENAVAVSHGIASHNLFDIAYALLLREREGVTDAIEFEMLEGMANHQARTVKEAASDLLLYAPIVQRHDFHTAIAYLVRRLDENTAPENFLHDLFGLKPGDSAWERQKSRFLAAVARKDEVDTGPRRHQNRLTDSSPPLPSSAPFHNAADTDWTLPQNREWIALHLEKTRLASPPHVPLCIGGATEPGASEAVGFDPSRPNLPAYHYARADAAQVERALATAVSARASWQDLGVQKRAQLLHQVAAEIENRRGSLIATMVLDAGKAVTEADVEISEAIDFAHYYAHIRNKPEFEEAATFTPLGTVVITPPWNFPFAIPCGGILAALAAGNTVILKPASATALTGWALAEALWAAGIPREVLQFLTCPGEVGRSLITDERVGAVVLTGAYETATRFLEWKPEMRLFAETSGKNSLIITAAADPDQAIKDLVRSAFGHSGQKCSAASLAIIEAELYDHPAFRRQLRDAAASLAVGSPWDLDPVVTPCTVPPGDDLARGLTQLDPGEEWLLEPKMIDGNPQLWSPGIRLDVDPQSWYRQTECFGPVLGLIRADNLDHAIRIQNDSEFGLTGGIHSLDDRELAQWRESVEVGNAYLNRAITGAIVQRQPFGGWKRSCFGPGAKAGGPNYLHQFGTFANHGLPTSRTSPLEKVAPLLAALVAEFPDHAETLTAAAESDAFWNDLEFSREHDPSSLRCESNHFRYRRFATALIRFQPDQPALDLARLLLVAAALELPTEISLDSPLPWIKNLPFQVTIEPETTLIARLPNLRSKKLGLVRAPHGSATLKSAIVREGLRWADGPVLLNARIEWPAWLREQSLSQTQHRYGNLISQPPSK